MFSTAIRTLTMKMNRIIGITMLLTIVVTQRVCPSVSNDEEEDEGGRSRKGRLGRRQQQAPEDTEGLLNRLNELKNACGGKK